MEHKRELAKKAVGEMKPNVMETLLAAKEGWTYYGEPMSVVVKGIERTMYFFSSGKGTAPAYFDIHGGGFAWGTKEDCNFYGHELAEQLGMNVYSLDYPLSPEHVYPSQLEYLLETIDYMVQNSEKYGIDPDRVIVGGRSAGANLAAALSIRARNQTAWKFSAQVLDHPWLDIKGMIPDSERYMPEGMNFMDSLRLLGSAYASDEEKEHMDCSPILAGKDVLCQVAPAVIQTCEYDSLRNDGDVYAIKLQEAGNRVIHRVAPEATHGYTEENHSKAEEGRQWLITALKEILL